MNFTEAIIIALLSNIPFALYQVWSGIKRANPEIQKLRADEKSSLSDAVEGAGKTLVDAWSRIEKLETWKTEASNKIVVLEDELRRWRNYAGRLIKQIKRIDPCVEPEPFETSPKISERINHA